MFKRRAMQQYGVEVNPGPLDTDSKPALILEKYAEAQGEEQGEERAGRQVRRAIATSQQIDRGKLRKLPLGMREPPELL